MRLAEGYTGDIDVYSLVMPADGRLQISLAWDHDSDFDLVLATDERGENRVAEGIEQGPIPECIGADVAAGQKLWIFVAGWTGVPGDYTLETILLRPGSKKFALDTLTDGSSPLPRNTPLEFVFTPELDPDQPVDELVFLIGSGDFAPGTWCIDGQRLVFLPHIPEGPDNDDVLRPGFEYLIQIPRSARGLRAVTGEYLDMVEGAAYVFTDWADPDPTDPPRVLWVDHDIAELWDGTLLARIRVTALAPLPSRHKVHIVLPGSIRRLGGTNGLTGLAPTPPGFGFVHELHAK